MDFYSSTAIKSINNVSRVMLGTTTAPVRSARMSSRPVVYDPFTRGSVDGLTIATHNYPVIGSAHYPLPSPTQCRRGGSTMPQFDSHTRSTTDIAELPLSTKNLTATPRHATAISRKRLRPSVSTLYPNGPAETSAVCRQTSLAGQQRSEVLHRNGRLMWKRVGSCVTRVDDAFECPSNIDEPLKLQEKLTIKLMSACVTIHQMFQNPSTSFND
ncbi:hypothetical protein J6590_004070 [Homalodisca vitripennis]|nr:hypothetical protein J6590_004070 [Homalodisca vitripennis]